MEPMGTLWRFCTLRVDAIPLLGRGTIYALEGVVRHGVAAAPAMVGLEV